MMNQQPGFGMGGKNTGEDIIQNILAGAKAAERHNEIQAQTLERTSMLAGCRSFDELRDILKAWYKQDEARGLQEGEPDQDLQPLRIMIHQAEYFVRAINDHGFGFIGEPESLKEVNQAWPRTPFGVTENKYGFDTVVAKLIREDTEKKGLVDMAL